MKSYNSGPKHPDFRHSEEKEKKSTLLTLVMLWLDSSQSVLADKQDLLDDNPAKRCEIPFPVFSVCQLQKKDIHVKTPTNQGFIQNGHTFYGHLLKFKKIECLGLCKENKINKQKNPTEL